MAEEWCDLCDLPLTTCVHGMPPPPAVEPAAVAKRSTAPRRRAATPVKKAAAGVVVRRTERRQTPPATFRPHIVAVLQDHGGSCEADVVLAEVFDRVQVLLMDRDHETVGSGEVRWRYAVRQERAAMTRDGLMEPARTSGVWELTEQGRAG